MKVQSERNQCFPQLVDVFGRLTGKGTGKSERSRSQISRSPIAARSHARLPPHPSGKVRTYAVITSIFDLRKASQKSPGARLSVISRSISERGQIRETLLRPNLLKSATTVISLEVRTIKLFSWASSTSGVEGPTSRLKPS